jgi:hypothetical protein
MTKLCEIKVDRADSLKELCYHLTANGYTVQTAVIWKEFLIQVLTAGRLLSLRMAVSNDE